MCSSYRSILANGLIDTAWEFIGHKSMLPHNPPSALKYLSRCSELVSLKLGLCTNISDIGLAHIALNCPKMTELDLDRCARIGDDGLAALATGCKKLTKLNLSYCNGITDTGMEYISHLGELYDLELRGLLTSFPYPNQMFCRQELLDYTAFKTMSYLITIRRVVVSLGHKFLGSLLSLKLVHVK